MEYTTLGNTDIQISKLCVGCMSFGKAGTMHDWTLDETETEKVVKHALSLGINFFDTANGYSAGTSEEYLGRALKKNVARDKVVIASKVYFNPGRLSAGAIHREIDGTLKRLGTDYLDLYIIHRFDYDTPIEETMEALNDLVKAGKVRALGASAMYGYQFYNMQLAARDHGWAQFQAMENHYNLLYREDERELIPICKQMGVSLMPYSPLAAGHLTRPQWNTDTLRSQTDRVAMGKYDRTEEQDMQIVLRVQELAERYGMDVETVTEETHLPFGNGELTIFPPLGVSGSNELGLTVLASAGEHDFLITGDMERATEEKLIETYELPELDVLMAGHHGSKNSTSKELLDAVTPGTVIISVGSNSYGHPAEDTLRRLARAGCDIYRTDRHGTVYLSFD